MYRTVTLDNSDVAQRPEQFKKRPIQKDAFAKSNASFKMHFCFEFPHNWYLN